MDKKTIQEATKHSQLWHLKRHSSHWKLKKPAQNTLLTIIKNSYAHFWAQNQIDIIKYKHVKIYPSSEQFKEYSMKKHGIAYKFDLTMLGDMNDL